jgi:hypothetical protein
MGDKKQAVASYRTQGPPPSLTALDPVLLRKRKWIRKRSNRRLETHMVFA